MIRKVIKIPNATLDILKTSLIHKFNKKISKLNKAMIIIR